MKCDIYEKDDNYYIEADMPGYKKDEINIDSENGTFSFNSTLNGDLDNGGRDTDVMFDVKIIVELIFIFFR